MRARAALTEELIDELATAIYTHPSKRLACQACGVKYETFRTWIHRSSQVGTDPLYTLLRVRCEESEARLAHEEFKDYKEATKEKNGRDAKTILAFMFRRFPSISTEKELSEDVDNKGAHAANRQTLLDNPPPKMLAELLTHGFWRFPTDMDVEDRARLLEIQHKYNTRSKLEGEKPCLLTTGTPST